MSEFGKELEGYFCKFTFGQFVTLILLELVTLFFVFYLGARFGPDLIGSRKELATQLPPEGPKSVDEIVGKPKVDYTYPEVLSDSPGRAVIKVKPSGMTAKEFERIKVVEEKPAGPVTVPVPEKVKVAEKPPIELPPTQPPAPEPTIPTVEPGNGSFAIQVGSYQTADEATRALEKLKGKGYSGFTTVGEIPNKGTWYRVRIGRFKNKGEAQSFLKKFKQKEKTPALVVLSKS